MIQIITQPNLIAKYQKIFVRSLKTFCTEKINCSLGYQGHNQKTIVFYSEKYDFWFSWYEARNRYWNAFGLGRPQENSSNSITVEINFPYKGVNRNVGGVFGVDEANRILILHRGKIGGGRVGIGKQLLFNNYRDEPVLALDDGVENEFCSIGTIGTRYFARQVRNFVSEVDRIKRLATTHDQAPFNKLNDFSFTQESGGTSTSELSKKVTIERTHGIVVNALAQLLETQGHHVGNDCNRDLYIHRRKKITSLFEIKRTTSPQSLYTAVGQLIVYSLPLGYPVNMFLVLPQKLNVSVEKRLRQEHNIRTLYYEWNDGEPVFKNINRYF